MGISDDTRRRVDTYGEWLERFAEELEVSVGRYRTLRSACEDFVDHETPPIRQPPELTTQAQAVVTTAPAPQAMTVFQTAAPAAPPVSADPFDRVDEALRRIEAAATDVRA